jgi:fatty-acyl-CoA synthase
MMNSPLLLSHFIERAERYFPTKQVISRTLNGKKSLTYQQIGERTRRLASALAQFGIKKGDRIGTFAWNTHRHLEAYFAIPGIGAVLHTINLRLSQDHIAYVINHAEDRVLFVDADVWPLIAQLRDQLSSVEAFVLMSDGELPEVDWPNVFSYEEFIAKGDPSFEFVQSIDETSPAGICYTSATTGKPKGVVYSHRGIYLHSMALGLADTAGLSEKDVLMPVVPMFHVNAWGLPFAATWFGTTQVMPGPQFTPQVLAELIDEEKVTLAAGVPTIWLGLLRELETGVYQTEHLRAILCGGSAAPAAMIQTFEQKYNIPFLHAYGMTETSPLVTVSMVKSYQADLNEEETLELRAKQGLVVPGLEVKVVGPNGEVKPDGAEMGELLIRGPWIADHYYKAEEVSDAFADGWLHTGDVATIDEEGFIKLVDRTKDLIKSGGEWISSVDLENAIMAHEDVFEAAVVSVPDPKWQERPVACVVLKDPNKGSVAEADIRRFLEGKFPSWWLPDRVIFMDELPKTSVGKFLKRALREQVKEQMEANR